MSEKQNKGKTAKVNVTKKEVERPMESFNVITKEEKCSVETFDVSQAYGWLDENVIVPSIRPARGPGKGKEPIFSWTDAFVAGICGTLRQQGVRLELLREIGPLFNEYKKKPKAQRAKR